MVRGAQMVEAFLGWRASYPFMVQSELRRWEHLVPPFPSPFCPSPSHVLHTPILMLSGFGRAGRGGHGRSACLFRVWRLLQDFSADVKVRVVKVTGFW